MDALMQIIMLGIAKTADFAAALIIGIAVLYTVWLLIHRLWVHVDSKRTTDEIRLSLGKGLSLSLEFLLAADIIQSAVAPGWNEIGKLAAIIVLRVLLNFFLGKEFESAQRNRENQGEG